MFPMTSSPRTSFDAMERNAHANGIPVEELRESEQRPYHQESYQSEETRQLTR